MKLLLINPRRMGGYIIQPPIGLGYLATIASRHCSSVMLWDMGISERLCRQQMARLQEEYFDIVGISVFSSDLSETNKLTGVVKSRNPATVVIIGGPHPTAVKDKVFNDVPLADYAMSGEAEIGFNLFLEKLVSGNSVFSDVPGLIYRDGQGNVLMNREEEIAELDDIEFPMWELMKPSDYPVAPHGAFYKNSPLAPMVFTRGCPMHCTFCMGAHRKPRARSLDNIKQEIRLLTEKYGVRELLIEDENFAVHSKLLTGFCNHMLSTYRGKISWQCPSGLRLDTLDEGKVRLMKASGCHSLSVGIEFGTEKMLRETKKKLSLATIREKLAVIKAVGGIYVTGFFMMGFPQETREDIEETIRFACSVPIHRAQFNILMPQPGTEIWNQFEFSGVDFGRFHVHTVSFKHPLISSREMAGLKRKAYLKFYLRPSIMIWAARSMHLSNPFFLVKRFFHSVS